MSTAEEMEAGRKRSQYFASPGTRRPHPMSTATGEGSGVAPTKNDGTTNVIPFGPTGNTDVQCGGGVWPDREYRTDRRAA